MNSHLTGRCACGAVRFEVVAPKTYGVCHCKMCRRWTGGLWMGVVASETVALTGQVTEWASSRIASRGFCAACGSCIWHKPRHTKSYTYGQGLFDDQTGWTLVREIFAEDRPDHIALADQGQKVMTGWGTLWAVLTGRLPK
ncbi:GFA family protein [Yoonia sp. 208BN28-4]|uniref:GFA family protein n=1 Tax=Yoonia sp. 208BN28-4 TaxID=3126505 RepID=UPI0030A7E384